MDSRYTTKTPRETSVIAKIFKEEITGKEGLKHATVIGLVGELGAGKTTFIKSFVRALGVKKKITSPTFVIMRRYSLASQQNFRNVFHIDAYRMNNAKDIKELGIEKVFRDPQNIVLVEWADRVKNILPKDVIWVKFMHGENETERHITFNRR